MAFVNKLYVLPFLVVLIILQIGGLERPGADVLQNDRSALTTPATASTSLPTRIRQEQEQGPEPRIEEHKKPLCSFEQIVRGKWVPKTLERPPYIPLSPRVRCLRSEDFSKPFPTYQWQPYSHPKECEITAWSPDRFCRALSSNNSKQNETITFVGDSLTLEHYASLVHLLGDRARLPPKAVKHGRIQRHICSAKEQQADCCINVVFRTDFFLTNLTAEVHHNNWRQFPPRVFVLNRGAHFTPDEELQTSLQAETLPALLDWNRQCQLLQMNCLLIWRTAVPGHPYCRNFTQPSESVEDMQRWIEEMSIKDPNGPYKKGEYHWQDFARQNALVMRLLLERWQPQLAHVRIHIMDSYRTNILRPDNHRSHMNDCLHSCSPGGGSDWNSQWLLHILELSAESQEIAPLSFG